jgi:prevent-host-death family protein
MKRKVSAMEARKRFGELLESVYYRGDEVVIERAGKPMGVLIPAERYDVIQQQRAEARERMMDVIHKTWERNKDVPSDVLEAEVDEAIRTVRREHPSVFQP